MPGVNDIVKALMDSANAPSSNPSRLPAGLLRLGAETALSAYPKPFQNTPESNQAAIDAAANFGPGILGKIVWHGSPHKFDRFDASKIGTGEGAQAYGHGVYLADDVGVAKNYQRALSQTVEASNDVLPIEKRIAQMALTFGDGTVDGALKWMGKFRGGAPHLSPALTPELVDSVTSKFSSGAIKPGGALYKADLPDEWIPKMLDWDKPLSQQPQPVIDGFRQMLKDQKYLGPNDNGPRQFNAALKAWRMEKAGMGEKDSGNLFWQAVNDSVGSPDKAAEYFRNAGVPGIRYLDGGSRSAGQGSYNYVVFPGLEDQVKILERNGQPLGLLGVGGLK